MEKVVGTASYVNFNHLVNLSRPDLAAFYARSEKPLAPGRTNGPMLRDCYILQYVHTGCGTLIINDKEFRAHAGQCFMTFPNAVTTQIADEHTPWGKTWVCLYGTKLPTLLKNIGITEETPMFPWESCPEVLEEMTSYIEILDKNSPSFEFDQAICGNKLLKLIYKHCENHQMNVQATVAKEEYIQKAIKYIEYNFSRKITVNDIAAHIGLNRTYFAGLFKSYTNETPQEFLLKRRIDKACEFLQNPSSTVASVAYSIGYDPRSFIRLFKQVKGIPPSEYKKSVLNKTEKQITSI